MKGEQQEISISETRAVWSQSTDRFEDAGLEDQMGPQAKEYEQPPKTERSSEQILSQVSWQCQDVKQVILILDFWPAEVRENMFLLFLSYYVYDFVTATALGN